MDITILVQPRPTILKSRQQSGLTGAYCISSFSTLEVACHARLQHRLRDGGVKYPTRIATPKPPVQLVPRGEIVCTEAHQPYIQRALQTSVTEAAPTVVIDQLAPDTAELFPELKVLYTIFELDTLRPMK